MGREKNGGRISSLVVYFRKMRWPLGKDKDSELNHMEKKSFSYWSVRKECFSCMVNFTFTEDGILKT